MKKLCRLPLALLPAIAALGFALPAAAQGTDGFPNRPVRIITPAAPGGTTDFLARLLATQLTKVWNQQVIVDNRGSASGINAGESPRTQPLTATPCSFPIISTPSTRRSSPSCLITRSTTSLRSAR